MDSATTAQRKLEPTAENGEESRQKAGGRVPSIDASDPLGGSSGPLYRDNLKIGLHYFAEGSGSRFWMPLSRNVRLEMFRTAACRRWIARPTASVRR
jgi:hypothetical protein